MRERRATPALHNLAQRVLDSEAAEISGAADPAFAAERACNRLAAYLSRMVGRDGFHALSNRALSLARSDFPFLQQVECMPDGSLQGHREAIQGHDRAEITYGFAAMLANVVSLLISFIGEELTMRLVGDVWPTVPPGADGGGPEEMAT